MQLSCCQITLRVFLLRSELSPEIQTSWGFRVQSRQIQLLKDYTP
jgi:hypothetical protein